MAITIEELQQRLVGLQDNRDAAEIIGILKERTIALPAWSDLEKEYNPKKHPVYTDKQYVDKVKRGKINRLTRFTMSLQKLAVKRMSELIFGIPVKRVYSNANDEEKRAAQIIEGIYRKNHVNALNLQRSKYLYAACETCTIWYTQEVETFYGGERSPLKLRCRTFTPMNGDSIYPLFDDYDDLIALSVEYTRDNGAGLGTSHYFETFTKDVHVRWNIGAGGSVLEWFEGIGLGKINGVWIYRPEPVWEDQSDNVYEGEWTISRNGNYIRKNARPNWVVFCDENVRVGQERDDDTLGRNVLKYPTDAKAQYATWEQAIDSIKFHLETIQSNFFRNLQLPDMSMENMKATPMSGEARKMLFLDSQLKVTDESGIWVEFFDREVAVIKAFAKLMFPHLEKAFETLEVEHIITPYQIRDESEKVNILTNATGGAAIMSQRTAVERAGYVDDVDEELRQIQSEQTNDLFNEPTDVIE